MGMKPEFPILLIDDDEAVLQAQITALQSAGYTNIHAAGDSRQVPMLLEKQEFEVILLDLAMPYIPGEELLKLIKENYPYIPVIVITATDQVDTAVKCMKLGAVDYMVKPIEKSRLLSGVANALDIRELRRRYDSLKTHLLDDILENPAAFAEIVTQNRKMRGLFQYIETIAQTDLTIFITGETGTGKELLARAIHRLSGREGELIPVNIAGLDDTLFSDTLFGHKKGAFTGAEEVRKGLIQQAETGTLFIDEIGDLSPASQIKLLRLLEYREYYSLGSDIRKSSKARFVLAASKTKQELLASENFRKELYYRIATHHIHVSPLRERKEDIPLLLHYFTEKACDELCKRPISIPDELYSLLDCYHFPGNVRELRSMVYDAVSRQEGGILSMQPFRKIITESNEYMPAGQFPSAVTFGERLPTLRQAADSLIDEALDRSKGNISIAANFLGISHQALSKRLQRRQELESI